MATTTRPRDRDAPRPRRAAEQPYVQPEEEERVSALRVLFRSYRPERTGTMPAGLLLIVIVGTLVLAALLNADATLRKSNAKDKGPWRHEVAEGTQTLSSALRADVPRQKVDELLGHDPTGSGDGTDVVSVEALVAEKQREEAAAQPPASDGGPTTTAAPTGPHLRTPTLADPIKTFVVGDSVAGSFGPGFQRVAGLTGLFNVSVDAKVSSGLSRPDYFNWPKHLRDLTKEQNPELMLVMFGANDSQNIALNGQALQVFSPEWYAEYRKRVGSTMDLLRSADNTRVIIWVGQPIMSTKSAAAGMDRLDYIFATEAQKRPWVVYFDSWPYFTDGDGQFQQRLPAGDGAEARVRENDGVHLSPQGADRLGWAVLGRLGKLGDLSQTKLAAPPIGQLPPLDVRERTEIPKPPDMNE
jgi:hypothetical protein